MKILTSPDDDFLYEKLLALLNQIKLTQGATALNSTLRRHSKIKLYMLEKQIRQIQHIEEKYFDKDGLNQLAIEEYLHRKSLQNNNVNVKFN